MIILSKEQNNFADWFINNPSPICVLTGHAGSGKTTVMKEIDRRTKAVWCAPSHQAKNVLANMIKHGDVNTIASALGLRPVKNYGGGGGTKFLPVGKSILDNEKIAIFDESSMIDDEQLKWILEKNISKILFCGDPAQLPPVMSLKSPVFDRNYPTYHLSKVFRQAEGSPILDFATDIRETGGKNPDKYGIKHVGLNLENVMEFYRRYPDGVAVCPTHKEKEFVNTAARKVFDVENSDKPFLKGERLLLESPIEPPNGPQNGDMVTISSNPKDVYFQGFRVWEMQIVTRKLEEFYDIRVPNDESERKAIENQIRKLSKEYRACGSEQRKSHLAREMDLLTEGITQAGAGYGVTIHKAQGSTYEDVLFLTGGMRFFRTAAEKKKMAYTACTRAAKNLILCEGVL